MKALYVVGVVIIVASLLPMLLQNETSEVVNGVDAKVLDQSLDKIKGNLSDVTKFIEPINQEIADIESKYKTAITSYDKIKTEANKKRRDDVFGSSASSKVVTVESLTEILALNNEIASVKSSVDQINSKISNTESLVSSEINDIKSLLISNNKVTKSGFTYERLLRTISTLMGMIVLVFSYKNDKRQTIVTKNTE